jgi:transposase
VQALLKDAYGLDVSLGSISNMERIASAALEKPVEKAAQYVRERAQVHQDETGWYQRGSRAWLWVATTPLVAVFVIALSRGTDVAKKMLGETFPGTLISDRWCAYRWVDALRRQLCWAHLLREWAGFIERGGDAKRIGELLLSETLVMFEWWHRIRDGTLARSTFKRKMLPLMREVGRLLRDGAVCPDDKVAGTCRDILKLEDALWTFVYSVGVAPTNNMAEQDLRTAVIWRKLSFGTWSEPVSRFVERMLTVVTTMRKQNRNVLDYLTAAIQARLHGRGAPSLLPVPTRARQVAA